ncbi:FkbM family methyltransferase [Cognatiyoonia sp. IB215182]|uniref:FkbM family methyltransferase n=1 Tax=Cognatiyoonia sp. IB215182 TaxID=3097353 RepID=UPI002A0DB743|nr:FkbM family methyltransferase [Cognatiyoonia sp. IB215182]MDX8354717.1 FkbM family methyltransferase [Cognatiyoonia sp. IB215182]
MQFPNTPSSLDEITVPWAEEKAEWAQKRCAAFLAAPEAQRFLFGRNVYTEAVLQHLAVAGIVDDYTSDTAQGGIPILSIADLPESAFVLALSGGRPLTVRRLLEDRGIRNIDYFTFLRWSGLDLPHAAFNDGFGALVQAHGDDIAWIYERLSDETSRATFLKLFKFRYSYDLDWLGGFTERQTKQYFEDFLALGTNRDVFLDIGGFDGFTTNEFARLYPEFKAAYVFEPESENFKACTAATAVHDNVQVLNFGASDENATIKFTANGSASRIDVDGELSLEVRRIDDVVQEPVTFIKMDIEGAEAQAIRGALRTISDYRPNLAICVYHRPSDFWEIPKAILALNPDYRVYLRHYTESIYETVMYFVPTTSAVGAAS